ncbi:MAG: hypothetical protein H6623_04685 [Bdellovibrionaceae bacterium]|nr:hypothetical protein [Pseudobdellovibrionaceae bacterium]
MNLDFLKPYLSIAVIVTCLFIVVYIKMENRRMGYALFDLAKKEKIIHQEQRLATAKLAKMTSAERVRDIAQSRLTFQKAKEGQVIRVAGSGNGAALVK